MFFNNHLLGAAAARTVPKKFDIVGNASAETRPFHEAPAPPAQHARRLGAPWWFRFSPSVHGQAINAADETGAIAYHLL